MFTFREYLINEAKDVTITYDPDNDEYSFPHGGKVTKDDDGKGYTDDKEDAEGTARKCHGEDCNIKHVRKRRK